MTKSIVLNGLSLSYELERKRVKNINLRVRRDGSVFVSASNGVPLQKIEEFMRSKAEFVLRARERMLGTAKAQF